MASAINTNIQVMLIDPRGMLRASLGLALETKLGILICAQATGFAEALTVLDETQPDVILFALSDEHSLGSLANLLRTAYSSSVIVLYPINNPHLALHATQSGAQTVLSEEMSLDILIAEIKKVFTNAQLLQSTTMERAFGDVPGASFAQPALDVLSEILPASHHNSVYHATDAAGRIALLTRREREVISIVAAGMNTAESVKYLGITMSTFRHHLTSIFKKLDVSNRVELTVYAYHNDIIKQGHETHTNNY